MMDWQIIGNFGFPIGLSVFLLTKLDTRLTSIEKSIKEKDGILDKLEDIKDSVKRKH